MLSHIKCFRWQLWISLLKFFRVFKFSNLFNELCVKFRCILDLELPLHFKQYIRGCIFSTWEIFIWEICSWCRLFFSFKCGKTCFLSYYADSTRHSTPPPPPKYTNELRFYCSTHSDFPDVTLTLLVLLGSFQNTILELNVSLVGFTL